MYRHPLKPIMVGVLIGLTLFVFPFILFKLLFLALVGAIVYRIVRWAKSSNHHHRRSERGVHPVFADTIRNMKDEDYRLFRQSLSGDYHYRKTIPITEVKESNA